MRRNPRVAEVAQWPFPFVRRRLVKRSTNGLLIVHNQTKMTTVVGGLFASLLQGNEPVAKIDEGHLVVFAAQLKFEQTPIKG